MLIGRRRPEHWWLLVLCLFLAWSVAAARAARMAKATKPRPSRKQGAHNRDAEEKHAEEKHAPRATRRRGTVTDEEGV